MAEGQTAQMNSNKENLVPPTAARRAQSVSPSVLGQLLGPRQQQATGLLQSAQQLPQQQQQQQQQQTQQQHRLKQRFTVIRKLGKGTYGKVQLAINKQTGQEVAIKTIRKSKIQSEQDLQRVRREIQIMSSIEHPHIIHIYEVFENRDKIVLVMQYAPGGELYEYVSSSKLLDDQEARRLFRQIATAIYYCHENKICHRDLKLENILLDEKNNAKLADFGLSNVFDKSRYQLQTFCGSPLYASPEIVQGSPYEGPEVDCWSLGVLLYTLVYGAMPFDGTNFKRLVRQIREAAYSEPKRRSQASPLIRRLLCADPTLRATIHDICADPWVNGLNLEGGTGLTSLVQVAQDMAKLTPVRMDMLQALAADESRGREQQLPARSETNRLARSPDRQPPQAANEAPEITMQLDGPRLDAAGPDASLPIAKSPELDHQEERRLSTQQLAKDQSIDQIEFSIESEVPQPMIEPMESGQLEREEKSEEKPEIPVEPKNEFLQVAAQIELEAPSNEESSELKSMVPMEIEQVEQFEMKDIEAEAVEQAHPTIGQEDREVVPMKIDEIESTEMNKRIDSSEEQPAAEEDSGIIEKRPQEAAEPKKKVVKKKIVVVKKKKKTPAAKKSDEQQQQQDDTNCDQKETEQSGDDKRQPLGKDKSDTSSTTSKARTSVGKVRIPESFRAIETPTSGEETPRGHEPQTNGRRQSTLIADVSQKLLQAQRAVSPRPSEIQADSQQLARVRVADKRDEFERRASLAPEPTLIPGPRLSLTGHTDETASVGNVTHELNRETEERPVSPVPVLAESVREQVAIFGPRGQEEARVERINRLAPLQVGEAARRASPAAPKDERSDSVETIRADGTPLVRSTMEICLGGPMRRASQEVVFEAERQFAQPVEPVGPAPIARSYKKVTFTKDGARVTETGKIFSTQAEDGSLRRIERKSRITQYPAENRLAASEQQVEEHEEIVYGGTADETPDAFWFGPSARPMRLDNDSMATRQQQQTRRLGRADSASSCSSTSTDIFDDIFDTWTGAISMFGRGQEQTRNLNQIHESLMNRHFGGGGGTLGRNRRTRFVRPPGLRSSGPSASSQQSPLEANARCESVEPHLRGLHRPLFGSTTRLAAEIRPNAEQSLAARLDDLELEDDFGDDLLVSGRMAEPLSSLSKSLWKGSSPSLVSVSVVGGEQNELQPVARTVTQTRTSSSSTSRRIRLAGSPSGPQLTEMSPTPIESETVTSYRTFSEIPISVSHQLPPRASGQMATSAQKSQSRASLIETTHTSITSTSLASGARIPSANFLGLKRVATSSRATPDEQQILETSRPIQDESAEFRVRSWLQDSAGNLSSSSGSRSSASEALARLAMASGSGELPPVSSRLAQATANRPPAATSPRRVSPSEPKAGQPSTAPVAGAPIRLDWLQNSGPIRDFHHQLADEILELESLGSQADCESRSSGSLLDQLRARGYKSMIQQRLTATGGPKSPSMTSPGAAAAAAGTVTGSSATTTTTTTTKETILQEQDGRIVRRQEQHVIEEQSQGDFAGDSVGDLEGVHDDHNDHRDARRAPNS